jgi:hypothetical protein
VLLRSPLSIPGDRERSRLVEPGNAVEIQKQRELTLTVVGKRETGGTGRLERI